MNTPRVREQVKVRKPYSEPRLEVYGDLRRITENKGAPVRADAGKSTHFGTNTGNNFGK
jgi:hypothetical protein